MTDTIDTNFDIFGNTAAPPDAQTETETDKEVEAATPPQVAQRTDDPPPTRDDLLNEQRIRVAKIGVGLHRAKVIVASIQREYDAAMNELDILESETEHAATPPRGKQPASEPAAKRARKKKTDDAPKPEEPPSPKPVGQPKSAQELGIEPGQVEANVSTMILFSEKGKPASVRSILNVGGQAYVVTPTGRPPSDDDFDLYMMRPLYESVDGKSAGDGADKYFGRPVEHGGKVYVIGPDNESILVRDNGR